MADESIIEQLAGGIASIESGGDYGVRGPVTAKGDRAYGKYQIMGANIPSWTRDALGTELTPDAFLADPDAQEKTARFRMGQYLDQYNGSMRDAASLWHSGMSYDQVLEEDRKRAERGEKPLGDQLGTKTTDYADRVAGFTGAGSTSAAPTRTATITGPDGRKATLTIPGNATPESIQSAIDAVVAQMGGGTTPPPETPPAPPAEVPTPPSALPARETDVDQSAADMNAFYGLAPDHPVGKYGASLGKPIADALSDVYNAFAQPAPAAGDPTQSATWWDALDRSLKLLHPLAVPAEAAGNVVFQGLSDVGAPPEVASLFATAASLYAGAKTPVPGVTEAPTTGPWYRHVGGGNTKMPFQGTAATRAAAQDADAAVNQAREAVATAQGVEGAAQAAEAATVQGGDVAVAQADELATAARATAEDAARSAEAAAATAKPAPEAAARARAALTPGGGTATEGSAAVTGQLERELKEIKDPVQGIYNSLIENAEAEHRSLDPSNYKRISEQIAALKEELGPTLSGQAKAVIENIENSINTGQRLGAKAIDAYKQQLDTLFEGRVPHGVSPKTRALYDFKWEVRDMMRSMYDGEEKQWAEAADALWRDTIIGKDSPTALGNLVKLAKKNPQTFAERVLGNGTADKQGVYARAVMKHLDDAGKAQMREAVLSRAIDSATDATTGNLDPAKLLQAVGKYNRDFYEAIVSKDADAVFKTLRAEQSAVGETAGAAARGSQWATAAEREAAQTARGAAKDVSKAGQATAAAGRDVAAAERGLSSAEAQAEKAAAKATEPNRLARFTSKGIEFAIGEGVAAALGHPGAGLLGAGRFLLPADGLAKMLADSTKANLLARALKTPFNSPAGVAIIETLRNRDTSTNFLRSESPE